MLCHTIVARIQICNVLHCVTLLYCTVLQDLNGKLEAAFTKLVSAAKPPTPLPAAPAPPTPDTSTPLPTETAVEPHAPAADFPAAAPPPPPPAPSTTPAEGEVAEAAAAETRSAGKLSQYQLATGFTVYNDFTADF